MNHRGGIANKLAALDKPLGALEARLGGWSRGVGRRVLAGSVLALLLGVLLFWALERVSVMVLGVLGFVAAAGLLWWFVRRLRPSAASVALVGAALVLIGSYTALEQVDAVLRGMHRPGASSFDVASLVKPFAWGGSPADTREVLETWKDHCASLQPQCPPRSPERIRDQRQYVDAAAVVRLHLVVEWLLFIPAYVVLLWVSLRAGGRRLEQLAGDDDHVRQHVEWTVKRQLLADQQMSTIREKRERAVRVTRAKAAPVGVFLVIAAACFDAIENGLIYKVVADGWRAPTANLDPTVALLSVVSWSRRLTLAVALLIAVVLFTKLLAVHRSERVEFLRALLLLRLQVVFLAAFALLLLAHEQVPDVLRRWGMDGGDQIVAWSPFDNAGAVASTRPPTTRAVLELFNAGFGLVLTLVFGLSVTAMSVRLIAQVVGQAPRALPRMYGRRLGVLLAVPAGVALFMYMVVRWDRSFMPAAPIAVIAVYLCLYSFAGTDPPRPATSPLEGVSTSAAPQPQRYLLATGNRLGDLTPLMLVASAALAAVPFLALRLPDGGRMAGPAMLVPAVILAMIGLLGLLTPKLASAPRLNLGWGQRMLPGVLGAIPIGVLGLAMVRSFVAEAVYVQRDPNRLAAEGSAEFAVLFGIFLLAAAPGLAVWLAYHLRPPASALPGRSARRLPLVATVGLVVVLAIAAYASVVRFVSAVAPAVGTIGIVAAFLTLAGVLGSWLMLLAERYQPPVAFKYLSLRRVPVLLLLLIWLVIASQLNRWQPSFHNVQPLLSTKDRSPQVTLSKAFSRWRSANCLPDLPADRVPAEPVASRPRTAVPLVLVAASGGGIRAAYWTSMALQEVVGRHTRRCSAPLFAASGVSGGSLGLVTYAAARNSEAFTTGDDWPTNRLGGDYLAPNIAWALFVEVPRSFVGFSGMYDRARVLERAWEGSWADDLSAGLGQGLAELYDSQLDQPLLLLNGTSVETGCRFVVSPLTREGPKPSTTDCLALQPPKAGDDGRVHRRAEVLTGMILLSDLYCDGQDVRLSTAALLSARFPFVSPSGRVAACGEDGVGDPPRQAHVVDGGYFDSSGAWTALDLWEATQPLVDEYNRASTSHCVVPFFLQLDNGYDDPAAPDPGTRPHELQVPLRGVVAAQDSQSVHPRQEAEAVFGQPLRLPNDQQVVLTHQSGSGKVEVHPEPVNDRYMRFVRGHTPAPRPLSAGRSRTKRWTTCAPSSSSSTGKASRTWSAG